MLTVTRPLCKICRGRNGQVASLADCGYAESKRLTVKCLLGYPTCTGRVSASGMG
jgi:hypothetical protein